MVRCGDILTLEIIETNMLGNGVAKADNMVVFCRGAFAGDVVTAQITDVKKNYAEAECLRIESRSVNREEASCPYAALCGGCVFDGVTYSHECEVKKHGISAALRREGIRREVSDFIGSAPRRYRNKAVFHFDEEKNCGYFAAGSGNFVKIEKCLICHDRINEIKCAAEKLLLSDSSVAPTELTYLYIRYMKESDEASVVLGYAGEGSLEGFAKALADAAPSVKCVMRGKGKNPEASGEVFERVLGDGKIAASVSGIGFELSPKSFFQVNGDGTEKLCEEVVRLSALKDGERAADIYCGAGLFGLSLAKASRGAEVYGIELNEDSVRCANIGAGKNGITNAFFVQGDSSELKAKTGIDSLDVAVVDPPRTGLSKKTVEELIKLSPERIVYVSCNPSTLARDIKALSEHYEIKKIVGVDMFPRTKHVECVTLMAKK